MHCVLAFNHVDTFDYDLYGPISRLDRGYADETQIVEGHDLKYASRQSQNK